MALRRFLGPPTRRQSAEVISPLSRGTVPRLGAPHLQPKSRSLHPHRVLERVLVTPLQNPLQHLRNIAHVGRVRTLWSFSPPPKGQTLPQQHLKQHRSQHSTRRKWWKSPGGSPPGQKTLLRGRNGGSGWLRPLRVAVGLLPPLRRVNNTPPRKMGSEYPVPWSWGTPAQVQVELTPWEGVLDPSSSQGMVHRWAFWGLQTPQCGLCVFTVM